jgi:hypothetical protein
MDGVEIHHTEDTVRIASWERLLIMRFVGAPTIGSLRKVRDEQRALVDRVGGKVAMVSVIAPRAQIKFDDEARKSSGELLNEMKGNILVGTQIVVKQGFFGSIVRSVMMGVNMMSKPPYPTKVCSSVRDGADFVAEHLAKAGHNLMPDDIAAAISTVLEGLNEHVETA